MLYVHLPTLFLLLSCGFTAGFIDAIAGGGGLIMVPALLTVGIPPHLVLGTNKFAGTMCVFASAFTYVKHGLFNPLLWRTGILAAIIGAVIGALFTHLFSSEFFKHLLPIIVILVGIYILIPRTTKPFIDHKNFIPRKLSSASLGSILGFYDGFIGPGTGSFWTTAVMAIYKLDMVAASGVARFMNFISNIVALITFILMSNVDYMLGLIVGTAMFIGSYLGAHSAIKYGVKFIKPVFVTMVFVLAARLIYLNYG